MTGLPLRPWNGLVPLISLVACLCSIFLMALGVAAFWVSRADQLQDRVTLSGKAQPVSGKTAEIQKQMTETSGSVPDVSVIQSSYSVLAADHTAPVVILTVDDSGQVWLEEPRGAVELGEGEKWRMLEQTGTGFAEQNKAGQRVRTGVNSSVMLRFSDGHQVLLGAEGEVLLYQVDERTLALVLYRGGVQRSAIP